MKGPWPPWCDRDCDGRTMPPAPMPPMPPELAATVDPEKDRPGPRDDPGELAARVRTLTEARARRTPFPAPKEIR